MIDFLLRIPRPLVFLLLFLSAPLIAADPKPLALSWEKNFLTIRGRFPGDEIKIMYLEAYCRPGSTDRDWSQTVISHTARQLPATDADASIHLEDVLADGVVVSHVIKATADEVDFRIVAHNP